MKYFTVRSLVIMVVVLFCLPFSCSVHDDETSINVSYEIESYKISIQTAAKNSSTISIVNESPSILQDSIVFVIEVDSITELKTQTVWINSFSFGNQLYATPPTPIAPIFESLLDSIEVYSSDSLITDSMIYAPGSNINELLSAAFPLRHDRFTLNEYNVQRKVPSYEFIFVNLNIVFNQKIESIENQKFYFKLSMSDGKRFELETKPLTIK